MNLLLVYKLSLYLDKGIKFIRIASFIVVCFTTVFLIFLNEATLPIPRFWVILSFCFHLLFSAFTISKLFYPDKKAISIRYPLSRSPDLTRSK